MIEDAFIEGAKTEDSGSASSSSLIGSWTDIYDFSNVTSAARRANYFCFLSFCSCSDFCLASSAICAFTFATRFRSATVLRRGFSCLNNFSSLPYKGLVSDYSNVPTLMIGDIDSCCLLFLTIDLNLRSSFSFYFCFYWSSQMHSYTTLFVFIIRKIWSNKNQLVKRLTCWPKGLEWTSSSPTFCSSSFKTSELQLAYFLRSES